MSKLNELNCRYVNSPHSEAMRIGDDIYQSNISGGLLSLSLFKRGWWMQDILDYYDIVNWKMSDYEKEELSKLNGLKVGAV